MQYRVILVPHTDKGVMQEELNLFLRTHRVLKVDKMALPSGWSFCIEWLEGNVPRAHVGAAELRQQEAKKKIDYREVLSEVEFARFAKLRDERKKIADEQGLRLFIVATNEQLAAMAKMENPSLAEFRKLEGYGDEKIEKFGKRLLEVLS